MKINLAGRDLISISDLSREEIEAILATALKLQKGHNPDLLRGSLLASCFFEPSTRTRLSFEASMYRLGGAVVGFAEAGVTSVKKGETLFDTMKVIGNYADIVVIRHPQEGSARLAAEAIEKPVINAGDGANQHPTQTLIDLFTIRECQGKIDDLHIALIGDLKYGRTVHSLSLALAHYPVRLYFVAPEHLTLPEAITHELKKKGVKFSFHGSIEEVIGKVDVVYMSRVQKERFADANMEFTNSCLLKKRHLEKAKRNLRVLHALPRIDEIEESIDATDHAYYFQQAANGIPIRMALLGLLLGKL
jgi:aspartate carbamoyltransferase catalytic subunit